MIKIYEEKFPERAMEYEYMKSKHENDISEKIKKRLNEIIKEEDSSEERFYKVVGVVSSYIIFEALKKAIEENRKKEE